MSDFFIKTAGSGSTGWRKMSNLFVKTAAAGSTGWKAATSIFLRLSGGWIKVWPFSGVFPTRQAWIGPDSTTTYADRLTSSSRIRIGSNYYGNNAQWDPNGFTISSYSYAWKYYDQFGTELGTLDNGTGSGWTSGGAGQDLLPTTIWTSTVSTNTDRQYLRFQVVANVSNPVYSGSSLSPLIQIIRRIPINTAASLSTNSPAVGTQITYSSTWDTSEARKPEDGRTTVYWYRNSVNSTSGGTFIASGSTYTPQTSDSGNYIYVVETRFNSGTDYDLGPSTGVSVSVITSNTVSAAPDAFTFSLSNASSVTTPNTPTQTRVSSTSNTVLIEFASSTPADTFDYDLYWSGSGVSGGSSSANIPLINQYSSSSEYQLSIATSASNSPISTYVIAKGVRRTLNANVSTTTGAQSWAINFSWSNATSGGIVYYSNGSGTSSASTSGTVTVYTNSMPIKIVEVSGASNPTITINNITAYSGTNQSGATRSGTNGSPISLVSISRPTATSGTSTNNYTYYNPQYTVTWNATANGGSGGGTTTQNAGVAHTAPSASRNSFTITFSANGGTGSASVPSVTGTSPFVRWADTIGTSTGTGDFTYTAQIGGSFTPPNSITMYARWNQTTSNPVTLATQGTLSRSGFVFAGWDIGGVTYSAGSSYIPTANVTANAIWNPVYSVTFNGNGGTLSSGPGNGQTSYTYTGVAGTTFTIPSATRSGFTFTSWRNPQSGGDPIFAGTPGNTYTINGSITFWAQWQSNFVTPSAPAPSLASQRTSTIVRWYCDYPSVSGSVSSITSMAFEIRTTAGGGTLLASSTRAYPGAGVYPYTAAGTIWAFRCGTSDGDISYSASNRYARARVVMLGTDGNTYFGTWSSWILA